MSFLSKLFGSKINELTSQVKQQVEQGVKSVSSSASINGGAILHLKGVPDAEGLYPAEIVMLAVAEKYKTTESKFPGYLSYDYEIANPPKMLQDLFNRGYLEYGKCSDSLSNLKVQELKDIASSLGIATTGKKADIIERLANTDDSQLEAYVKDRTWKLTERGASELKANPYIAYFLEKHSYSVKEVGIDLFSVNKEYVKEPKRPYRDVIYRQLNDRMNEEYIAFNKDPNSGDVHTHRYCECLRMMGLFIEEEGKSYINASDFYFQYLFDRINIHAGLKLLKMYSFFKNDKKMQKDCISRYYDDIQLYPFHKTEILRLLDEANINESNIKQSLITSFERTNNSGIMSVSEAADFIIYELSGDVDKSRDLSIKAAQNAVKKIR